jgi:type IV pilus assembly protein PilX
MVLRHKSQSGVVLIVSLVMLLLLTLIGTSGMQTTIMEEKMASNMRDNNLAFQAAESALRAAEVTLVPVAPAVMPTFTDDGTGGFYSETTAVDLSDAELNTASFWTSNPVATSTVTDLGYHVATPIYIIEKLSATCYKASCPDPSDLSTPYRITVRATGGTSNSVVLLQSVFTPD